MAADEGATIGAAKVGELVIGCADPVAVAQGHGFDRRALAG
jgi:hypothetical protein